MAKMEVISGWTIVDKVSWDKFPLQGNDTFIDVKERDDRGQVIAIQKSVQVIRDGVREIVTLEEYAEGEY